MPQTILDGADYAPVSIVPLSLISSETFVDFFRDVEIRFNRYYQAVNTVSVLVNSLNDSMIGKISKIEKDIAYLENFIDNYEFISGKDDLYNYSYIENFDNINGSSEKVGDSAIYVDRDGAQVVSSSFSGGYIDSNLSKFKIGSSSEKINTVGIFKSITRKTNYENYISSFSDPIKMFEDKKTKAWSVSINSPVILKGLPVDIEKYINYNYSNIIGAKTILECELNKVIEFDSLKINPNNSYGLSLMQIAIEKIESNPITTQNSDNPSSNYVIEKLLQGPVDLSKPFTISFPKSRVRKIILIFNQDTYYKKNVLSSESENISRAMHDVVQLLRELKVTNHNKLQDIVLSYFRKGLSINEAKRNNYLYSEYYTYKYPIEDKAVSSSFYEEIMQNKGSTEYPREDRITQKSSPLTRMVESVIGHVIGDRFNAINTTLGKDSRSSFSSGRVATMSGNGFFPEFNSNNKDSFSQKLEKPIIPGLNFSNYSSASQTKESINTYNYGFSIGSIELLSSNSLRTQNVSQYDKAIFISQKIPVPGKVLGIKAKYAADEVPVSIGNDISLSKSNSYELSFSIKENPTHEEDWIGIVPYGQETIESEVLFFNKINKTAQLRFYPKNTSITLYEDGKTVSPFNYNLNLNTRVLSYSSFKEDSIYVCSYDIDNINYSQDYIDVSSFTDVVPLASSSTNGSQGEYFSSSGSSNIVQISNYPYVDYSKFSDAVYSDRRGTVNTSLNVKYSPVEIKLSNGSYAVNLTNYISGDFNKTIFYDTEEVLFYQNGKNIIFNKQINSPFYVIYNYINNNIRFRAIIRNNYLNSLYPGSLDNIIVKMKVNNMDNFSNKLLGIR